MQYTALGLPILPQGEKITTPAHDWVDAISGDKADSAFNLIDGMIRELQANRGVVVVQSDTEPVGLNTGDEWDKILQ